MGMLDENNAAKIISVATAVPKYKISQDDIGKAAARIFGMSMGDFTRLAPVYGNAAIKTRYSCVPLEWYERPCPFSERNRLYQENAVNLLAEAGQKALAAANLSFDNIDGLVVVSSSGIATPSLDALLMERLHLKRTMERLPIFGLGCVGGVLGLARTAQLARGAPDKRYLYMVVELCGLDFIFSDRTKSNVIATALFADGASAAVISCKGTGPAIAGWSEHTWADSLNVMGWDVTDDGLRVVFSQDIPSIVRNDFGRVVDSFLSSQKLERKDMAGYLCHPGGAKVIDAIESALDLAPGHLRHAREILRDYGNMSAATVMFVLEAGLRSPSKGYHLISSFGPGFTTGLVLMQVA
jgi:alkylresorcinol/alkylpyrone synthase